MPKKSSKKHRQSVTAALDSLRESQNSNTNNINEKTTQKKPKKPNVHFGVSHSRWNKYDFKYLFYGGPLAPVQM